MTDAILDIHGLNKGFTLHNQGAAQIAVFDALDLRVEPGECVVLGGPSGVGKSTLMRAIYGNYLVNAGTVNVRHRGSMVDIRTAPPRQLTQIRRETMGYVSQFLRVIPRVPTFNLVVDMMLQQGAAEADAAMRAKALLTKLNLPEGHWDLPPATFSGGEQQRVNIARGFAHTYPAMLLDEPTASLDAQNRETVLSLIEEAKARGAAIVGIFHDVEARNRVCDREIDVSGFTPDKAA